MEYIAWHLVFIPAALFCGAFVGWSLCSLRCRLQRYRYYR